MAAVRREEGDGAGGEVMALYRKKPIVVDAIQWHGWQEGPHDLGITRDHISLVPDDHFGWIKTLEGGHIVTPGDWIITGVEGEKYPCKPHIFEATYEPVEAAARP